MLRIFVYLASKVTHVPGFSADLYFECSVINGGAERRPNSCPDHHSRRPLLHVMLKQAQERPRPPQRALRAPVAPKRYAAKSRQSARPSLELGEGRAHTTRPHWRTAYLPSPPPPRSAQHKPWMSHASVGLRAHAFDMKHKHGCAGTSRTYLGHKHAEKDIIMCGRGAASGLRHDGIKCTVLYLQE